MTAPPPIGAGNPAFLAVFHIPGLALPAPVMEVAGIWLQRLSWSDWMMVEHSDQAFRMHGEFESAEHVFCAVNLEDFSGSREEAFAIQDNCEENILRLVRALRLHKAGTLVDPRASNRYLRLKDLNLRTTAPYGYRLLEGRQQPPYALEESDLQDIAALHDCLVAAALEPDATIDLALRNFEFSYGYGLSLRHRFSFLFIALEAVYGEYRKSNRPKPRVSLGTAAAIVSKADSPAQITEFLDGAQQARGLRNRIAHGNPDPALVTRENLVLLEDIVRDGLRALVSLAARWKSFTPNLEAIEPGLASMPRKFAFQKLISHAAVGNAAALAAVASIVQVDGA